MRSAAIGLDHRHIHHMVGGPLEAGADCAGFDPLTSDPRVLAGFRQRFPQLREAPAQQLLGDPAIDLVVCAGIPSERATPVRHAFSATTRESVGALREGTEDAASGARAAPGSGSRAAAAGRAGTG